MLPNERQDYFRPSLLIELQDCIRPTPPTKTAKLCLPIISKTNARKMSTILRTSVKRSADRMNGLCPSVPKYKRQDCVRLLQREMARLCLPFIPRTDGWTVSTHPKHDESPRVSVLGESDYGLSWNASEASPGKRTSDYGLSWKASKASPGRRTSDYGLS